MIGRKGCGNLVIAIIVAFNGAGLQFALRAEDCADSPWPTPSSERDNGDTVIRWDNLAYCVCFEELDDR